MIGQFHVARRMIVGAADDRETLPKSRISKSMVDPKTIALARGAFRRVPTPLGKLLELKKATSTIPIGRFEREAFAVIERSGTQSVACRASDRCNDFVQRTHDQGQPGCGQCIANHFVAS